MIATVANIVCNLFYASLHFYIFICIALQLLRINNSFWLFAVFISVVKISGIAVLNTAKQSLSTSKKQDQLDHCQVAVMLVYCSSGGLCLSVSTHPSNQLVVQTLQKLLSWVDATILTGGKITVSQSKTQTWRPWWWQQRLSLWLTSMTDGLEGRRVTSSWKQSGRRTPIWRRTLVLSNNTDSRTAGWWMWPVTPM